MKLGVVGAAWILSAFAVASHGGESLTPDEVAASAARIDAAVDKAVAVEKAERIKHGLPVDIPAEPVDDAAFLRRACVDLCGRLPTAKEASAFITDSSPRHGKRARMIDRLLREPAAGDWRFQRMAEPLRVKSDVLGVSQETFVQWLRDAMRKDVPFDQLMAQMLGARGTLADDPAAGFLLQDRGRVEVTTAEITRAFLAADIHCAGCHDHPFADWTQRQFYEFAACFNFVQAALPTDPRRRDRTAALPAVAQNAAAFADLELGAIPHPMTFPDNYKYSDGKPGEILPPSYLPLTNYRAGDPRGAFVARPSAKRLRDELVLWLTGRQNQRFTAVAAVRIWDWMFGIPRRGPGAGVQAGSSDPMPPHQLWSGKGCGQAVELNYDAWMSQHPAFVTALRSEFEGCGCRLGEFQKVLAHTQAYQEAALETTAMGDLAILPAPVLRRLPAEVVWDALVSWLPPLAREGLWQASLDLPQVPAADHPLRILGRGTREWADESRPAISHAVARMMAASPIVEEAVASDSALLVSADVDQLFLRVLGRLPSEPERLSAAAYADSAAAGEGLPGIAWALLNTEEFLFYR